MNSISQKYLLLFAGIQLAACASEQTPLPSCLQDRIDMLKAFPPATPRASLEAFHYQGRRVYYLPPAGFDDFGLVVDEHCNTVCAPDGGISGGGDGTCPEFFLQARPDGTVWTDER